MREKKPLQLLFPFWGYNKILLVHKLFELFFGGNRSIPNLERVALNISKAELSTAEFKLGFKVGFCSTHQAFTHALTDSVNLFLQIL